MQIDLIVGSMLGTTENVADEIEKELIERHQVTQYLDPDLLKLSVDGSHIWLICSSTHGDGDFPDNVQPFAEQLKGEEPDLSRLHYAIISLGSSQYDTFCQAGKNFDTLLHDLGAERIGTRLEIDTVSDSIPEDTALAWLAQWEKVLELSPWVQA